MRITAINNIKFGSQKTNTSFVKRLFYKNQPDTVEISSHDTKIKRLYEESSQEEFNKYLSSLNGEKMIKQVIELNKAYGILPTVKMDEENIAKFIANAPDYETVKKLALMGDRHNSNIFQRGDASKIDLICSNLEHSDIILGVFTRNLLGSNAFHTSLNDPEKIDVFCKYLEEPDIKYVSSSKNSSNASPFMSYPIETFEVLLGYLSDESVKAIVQNLQANKSYCFFNFNLDKLNMVCARLTPSELFNMLKAQDEDGNTAFHVQSLENIEAICKYLDDSAIDTLMNIKNKERISAKEAIIEKKGS